MMSDIFAGVFYVKSENQYTRGLIHSQIHGKKTLGTAANRSLKSCGETEQCRLKMFQRKLSNLLKNGSGFFPDQLPFLENHLKEELPIEKKEC